MILDDNNRVIQYLNTSIENPTDTNYLLKFEYTSGNLTKIYNDTVSWGFSYDNKKNFHTFSSGFSDGIKAYSNSYSDAAGIFWLDKNLSKILRNIPKFYSFLNKNNPEDYSKNGVIYRSLSYSYNENKYPTEMVDEKSDIKIQLEYEKVE